MISILSTDILSPLGIGSRQNYEALRDNRSSVQKLQGWRDIPYPFCASIFSADQEEAIQVQGYTRFESMIINSVERAVSQLGFELPKDRTILILSTTKGDILELTDEEAHDRNYHRPAEAADRIAAYFGISTPGIVSCNACISGTSAQILADRLINAGYYDYAIVCGADCVSSFVASGFQAFRSLSLEECRPFDIERTGLNLGEAAATIIFGGKDTGQGNGWTLVSGALTNDAYHLSAPSPSGEGSVSAIRQAIGDFAPEDLSFINAHGTATMFNDQMESVAICKAGLGQVPVIAVKAWYGHTLGASGVLESIISMESVNDSAILPVRGFNEIGVSGAIDISNSPRKSGKRSFLKMISGFGGCNASALYTKDLLGHEPAAVQDCVATECLHTVKITESSVFVDGEQIQTQHSGKEMLSEIYKKTEGDYPKFYKMDLLSRLVYLATELLLGHDDVEQDAGRAVILFNRTGSVMSDRNHLRTIMNKDNYYPSPSMFLYTLPNIMVGEVAIRHGYKGETSLYITDQKRDDFMQQVISASFQQSGTRSMITGWVDCSAPDCFEADLKLLTNKN